MTLTGDLSEFRRVRDELKGKVKDLLVRLGDDPYEEE